MNMNQIVNMVIRIIMRKVINSGIQAGIGAASGLSSRSKGQQGDAEAPGQMASAADRAQEKRVQTAAGQARKTARITRI